MLLVVWLAAVGSSGLDEHPWHCMTGLQVAQHVITAIKRHCDSQALDQIGECDLIVDPRLQSCYISNSTLSSCVRW